MNPELLNDEDKPWMLNLTKPTKHQLTDWAIRLDPKLALEKPKEAIEKIIALYMRAGEAEGKWKKLCIEFSRSEMSAIEKRLKVGDKEDTLRTWLQENAKHNRDKIKTVKHLLEAIRLLNVVGVAKGKNDFGEWMVDKLQTRGSTGELYEQGASRKVTSYSLSERQAKDFLRLRQLYRETQSLQNEYAASLKLKVASKKIVAEKKEKAVKKKPIAAEKPRGAAKK